MEEFIANLQRDLPEECIMKRRQFEACKLSVDPVDLNEPLSRTKGCRNHWLEYDLCVNNFNERYMTLKNIEAKFEGRQLPFNLKEERDYKRMNLTKDNFGLDKF